MSVSIANHALVTVAEAVTFLNLGTGYDSDLVTTIINHISKDIGKFCNRDFIQTDQTEYYDGTATEELYARNWPILDSDDDAAISDPVLYYDQDMDQVWRNISTDGLTLRWEATKDKGIFYLKYRNRFPRGRRNLKLVYTAGYLDRDSVAGHIKEACMEIVGVVYDRQTRGDGGLRGVQSVSTLSETVTYNLEDWPKHAREILNRERRIII